MKDIYTIFVLDNSLNEEQAEYYEVVQWSYNNLEHPNVIPVTIEQIHELEDLKVLSVIAELNDSLLGEAEDDWVIDDDIKVKILDELSRNTARMHPLVQKVIKLFEYSIEQKRHIYFHF